MNYRLMVFAVCCEPVVFKLKTYFVAGFLLGQIHYRLAAFDIAYNS